MVTQLLKQAAPAPWARCQGHDAMGSRCEFKFVGQGKRREGGILGVGAEARERAQPERPHIDGGQAGHGSISSTPPRAFHPILSPTDECHSPSHLCRAQRTPLLPATTATLLPRAPHHRYSTPLISLALLKPPKAPALAGPAPSYQSKHHKVPAIKAATGPAARSATG
jgi:hypothetical protein